MLRFSTWSIKFGIDGGVLLEDIDGNVDSKNNEDNDDDDTWTVGRFWRSVVMSNLEKRGWFDFGKVNDGKWDTKDEPEKCFVAILKLEMTSELKFKSTRSTILIKTSILD